MKKRDIAISIILSIVTCGIYGFYWNYKMGELVKAAQTKRGLTVKDNSILYIILYAIGLEIVVYALLQSDLNEMATQ